MLLFMIQLFVHFHPLFKVVATLLCYPSLPALPIIETNPKPQFSLVTQLRIVAGSPKKTRAPTALVLQVQATSMQAKATLIGAHFFNEAYHDAATDASMIWCTDLLSGRQASKEALAKRSLLPANSDIQYFQPTHSENPSAFSHVTNTGLEEYIQGAWCCAFTAQNLTDMKVVLAAFFRESMGLGLPVRDNGFMHEMPQHKYLTRTKINSEQHVGFTLYNEVGVHGRSNTVRAVVCARNDGVPLVLNAKRQILCRLTESPSQEVPL